LDIGGSGVIEVTTQNTGAKPAACVLVLTPSAASLPEISAWTGSHSGCDSKYVPSNFR
jgi:hypothetical protein